jgi:hypothetical protein
LNIRQETKNYYCPHHKKKLVLREAKHGVNRGQKFWGCPTWSKTACNYTVPYESFKKLELPLKEKIALKIRNKNGKINPFRLVGMILMIPVYVLGLLITFLYESLPNRKKFH